jgi:hypothetical protein
MPVNTSPVFVGGFFKSGTSLLRAMLGQHSNIASGLETYWFQIDLNDSDKLQKKISQLAKFYEISVEIIQNIAGNSISQACFLDYFMSEVAARQGKKRWLEKTPGNILHIENIFAYWPKAQFLHIVRDPRDIFASQLEAKTVSSPEEFARKWSQFAPAEDKFSNNVQESDGRFFEIRYESLVNRSEEEIRRILLFLGERWEGQVAKYSGNRDDFNKVLDVTGKKSTTLQRLATPLTKSRVGIWRQVLTAKDLTRLEKALSGHNCLDIFHRQFYQPVSAS